MKGTLMGILTPNYLAYEYRKCGNPFDDWNYDLNRSFLGSTNGSITQRIDNRLVEDILPRADLTLALHSGGNNIYVCPRVIVPIKDEKHLELAKAMGSHWSLIARPAGERANITTNYAGPCIELGIPELTVELGGANKRLPEEDEKDVNTFQNSVLSVMKHYGMLDENAEYADEITIVDYEPLRNTHGGLIQYAPECQLNSKVKKDTLLMTIVDIFGNKAEEAGAPYDMIILSVPAQPYLPNGGAQIMTIGEITELIKR